MLGRVREALPTSLLGRTRALLLALALANALPLVPLIALEGSSAGLPRLVAGAALLALLASWLRTLRTMGPAWASLLLEVLALLPVGYVSLGGPTGRVLFVWVAYMGVVFRCLSGGPRRVATTAVAYAVALDASFLLAPGPGPALGADLLTNTLGIVVTALFVWLVARTLRGHEAALGRERALGELLAHRASHDNLTGVANRSLFFDRLEHALAQARRRGSSTALLFLDLDGFKAVNDGLGHGAGDDLLREVAQRLASHVRAADTVARIGGDEFTILLEDTDADDARRVADLVEAALRVPCELVGGMVTLGASVGIALTAAGDATADELVRQADEAMYRCKAERRASHPIEAARAA
jgi:diguanylate cyclase (GGDEF)-like protein